MTRINLKKTLVIGTAIRLFLMPLTAHPYDVNSWYNFCEGIIKNGINFNIVFSVNPLWFITLIPVAFVYKALSALLG